MNTIRKAPPLIKRFFEIWGDEGFRRAINKTVTKISNKVALEQNREQIYLTDETHFQQVYKTYIATGENKIPREFVPLPTYDLSNQNLPVKAIAFYLPQFHPIPENDAWWGKGFTEWTNVSKAVPNFVGHYQPHLPGELGFYDLRLPEVLVRQAELAKQFGIFGFCFYYYWFNGKRLLALPLERFIQNPKIDLPFCLCWANENWTRTWDGLEKEVLIAQNHSPESDFAFIKDIIPIITHERYIRIGGRPLLVVYRPQILPDPIETVNRWRSYCKERGVGELFLVAVQSGRVIDPTTMGFDAAAEFPPHGIPNLPQLNSQLKFTNPEFNGMVFDYRHVAHQMSAKAQPGYKLFKGVVTCWDNTPRRQDQAMIFHNSSPARYQSWLSAAIRNMVQNAPEEERITFINAWNEWAEGTHLEPDRKYGYAYLDATARALQPALNYVEESKTSIYDSQSKKKSKLAVIFHLYYPELWEEILYYLNNLKQDFDLFVSIPVEVNFNEKNIIDNFPDAVIYRCANRGRDIAPFLRLFSTIAPMGYQYGLKIHTKKSLHRADGSEWRTEILDELLGSDEKIKIIKQWLDIENVGIIGPRDHIISTRYFMGGNQPLISELAEKLELNYSGEYFNFIAGSMFWFKPEAIAEILNLNLTEADFPEETGQIDATLAHALERILCLLADKQGFQVIQTGSFTGEANDDYDFAVPYHGAIAPVNQQNQLPVDHTPSVDLDSPEIENKGLKRLLNLASQQPPTQPKTKITAAEPELASLSSDHYIPLTPTLSGAILAQATSKPTQRPDIIILPSTNWEQQSDDKRGFIHEMIRSGHRVFFIQTNFSEKSSILLKKTGEGMVLVRLPIKPGGDFADADFSLDDIVLLSFSIKELAGAFNIHSAILEVEKPTWHGLAVQLCDEFGWKLVYNSWVDPSDGSQTNKEAEKDTQLLLSKSDLVIFSTEQQMMEFSGKVRKSIVLRKTIRSTDASQKNQALSHNMEQTMQVEALVSVFNQLFPKISIIVVTYNKLELTMQCLESILKNTEYPNYEIIIVDNGSVDKTVESIKGFMKEHGNITLIQNEANLGFAAANNLGAVSASGEYLVLLNNDTVVTPGWVHRLLFHLNNYPKAGMVGPVTNAIGNEARINISYTDLDGLNYFAARRTRKYAGISFKIPVLALYCAMIPRSLYMQVGGLDERYQVGMFEDDDLALKIQYAGFNLLCAEDVFIHHFHGASFNQFDNRELQQIFHENKKKFEEKWGVTWQPHQTRLNIK